MFARVARLSSAVRRASLRLLEPLLFLAIVGQLLLLYSLPYKSSWLERGAPQEAAPSPDFNVGSVHWDVTGYARDPSLEPLRAYYRRTCGDKKGLAAAVEISRDFAARFPFGVPRYDFFRTNYSPVEDFRDHVEGGEPGHCVTMAGLVTGVLLSAGCPARVVQVYSTGRKGHNILEVWDEAQGWVMVDPSYMFSVRRDNALAGSADNGIAVRPIAATAANLAHRPHANPGMLYFNPEDGLLRGARVYPEPWLYLRTDPRTTPWPFRGRFVVDGPRDWSFGPAQSLLLAGPAACGLILLFTLSRRVYRQLGSRPPGGRPLVGPKTALGATDEPEQSDDPKSERQVGAC